MSPAREVSDPSRRSWKGAQTVADPRAARRVRRILWSAFGALLLACFVWLLVRNSGPEAEVHAVYVAVGDYDVLQAPPLAFADETLVEFQALKERRLADLFRPQDARTANAMSAFFKQELPRLASRPDQDVVVAYLAAHGVSESLEGGGAEAWLLCSNYDPLTNSGKYPLDDLLGAMKACQAKTKLLLLDAGSIETDLALGMVINEFPDLLREKVAALGDPKLWVIVSHDTFERSHAAYADRRSVFGYFAARGLAGEADRDANGVDLRELFDYVRDHVARYVWQASAQEATQTPFLMAAADQNAAATSSSAAQQQLTPFRPRPSPEPAKAESPPITDAAAWRLARLHGGPLALAQAPSEQVEEPGAANAASAAKVVSPKSAPQAADKAPQSAADPAKSAPPPTAEPDGGTAKPAGPPNAAGPPAGPASAAQAGDADAKQKAQPADAVPLPPEKKIAKPRGKPVFEELLLEQWLKLGALGDRKAEPWAPVDYAPHLWLRSLELLRGYELQWERGAGPSNSLAQQRLAAVWNDADWNARRQRFETSAARARLEQHADLMAAVRQRNELCFRLNFYIPWAAGAGEAASNDVGELLETLAELMRQLRNPPGERSATAETPGAREWLAKLRELRESIQRRTEVLDRRWQDAVKVAISDPLGKPLQIEALLALPWIAPADRAALVDRLQHSLPLADADEQGAAGDRTRTQARSRARALQRANLQGRRLHLAEAPANDETGQIAGARRAPASSDSEAIRPLGAALAKTYRGLAEAIVDTSESTDSQLRRAIEDRLRLVDVRSVQRLDTTLNVEGVNPPIDCPFPDLGIAWELKLTAVKPTPSNDAARGGEAALKIESPTTLEWRLEAAPPAPAKASWSLEYDRAKLQIDPPINGEIELAASRSETPLRFSVKARTETGEPTSLMLRVQLNDRSVTDELTARLPSLQPVQLIVGEPTGLEGLSERFDDRRPAKIVLHPLSSGRTNFHLSLHNPSGRERKLKYRLLALNRAGLTESLLEAWPLTPGGDLSPGFQPLFPASQLLTIPAEKTISLPLPTAPDKTPPAPDKAPSDKTPPAPRANPSIADGLLCELTDISTQPAGEPQWFWIDLAPLHPQKYLTPTVEYNLQTKRIEIALKARDRRQLPSQGAKVLWRVEGDEILRQASPSTVEGKVTAEAPELRLFAAVEPLKGRPLEIMLDVDGYPRAFSYDVWCDRPRGEAPRKLINYWDVRFLEPKAATTWLPDGARVGLRLRVDVPPDWFEQPGHVLQVGIRGDEQEMRRFRSDRRFDLRLLPAEAAGELAIETSVGDLEAEIETVAHPNQDLEIVAELAGANRQDQRTVKLDRDPPEIRLRGLRPRAVQGQSLTLELPVNDVRSGVKKVEVRIDLDGAAETKPALAAPSKDDRDVFIASLPVKELPVGEYTALIQATDFVGNKSPDKKLLFEVVKAPPAGDAEPAKRLTQFNGKVTWNGKPGLRVTVSATGPKNVTATADPAGLFTLPDLPPGNYQMTFKGVVKGVDAQFSQSLTINPPGKKPQEKTFDAR